MHSMPIELLQRMPIFGAIRDDTLRVLLDGAGTVAVRPGECFFREGEAANSMYVLESGCASVLKAWQGRDFVLHQLDAGDCFGEMALMDLCPRSATVRADAACRAITFTSADLFRVFESDAEQFALIQMNLGREVCRRLRATDELLFRCGMGEVPVQTPGLSRAG